LPAWMGRKASTGSVAPERLSYLQQVAKNLENPVPPPPPEESSSFKKRASGSATNSATTSTSNSAESSSTNSTTNATPQSASSAPAAAATGAPTAAATQAGVVPEWGDQESPTDGTTATAEPKEVASEPEPPPAPSKDRHNQRCMSGPGCLIPKFGERRGSRAIEMPPQAFISSKQAAVEASSRSASRRGSSTAIDLAPRLTLRRGSVQSKQPDGASPPRCIARRGSVPVCDSMASRRKSQLRDASDFPMVSADEQSEEEAAADRAVEMARALAHLGAQSDSHGPPGLANRKDLVAAVHKLRAVSAMLSSAIDAIETAIEPKAAPRGAQSMGRRGSVPSNCAYKAQPKLGSNAANVVSSRLQLRRGSCPAFVAEVQSQLPPVRASIDDREEEEAETEGNSKSKRVSTVKEDDDDDDDSSDDDDDDDDDGDGAGDAGAGCMPKGLGSCRGSKSSDSISERDDIDHGPSPLLRTQSEEPGDKIKLRDI